ncbi:MAG: HNH endonuclease [Pseudobutyrivibrio sp.]|nr:HNH endonuclease [Pseudobutyrivibrio sp.]
MSNARYQNGALRRKYRARFKAMDAPCGICRGRFGPIHYDEPSNAAHPMSFVIDEIKPISRFKEFGYESKREAAEDWNNLQAAHYWCNAQKSNKLNFSLANGERAGATGGQPKPNNKIVLDGDW